MGQADLSLLDNSRLEYLYDQDNIKNIMATIDLDKEIVIALNLSLKYPVGAEIIKNKYQLATPESIVFDVFDRMIEYYPKEKTMIYYLGNSAQDAVYMIRFYAPDYSIVKKNKKKCNEMPQIVKLNKVAGVITYDQALLKSIGYKKNYKPCKKRKTIDSEKISKKQDKQKQIIESKKPIYTQDNFKQAQQYLNQGSYEKAIPFFEKLLSTQAHASHRGLGICYLKLKNIDKTIEHLNEAMRLNKKDPTTVFFYSILHEEMNKPLPARHFYKKYLKLKHSDEEMNKIARQRLQVLRGKSRGVTTKMLFKIFDAVKQDTADF